MSAIAEQGRPSAPSAPLQDDVEAMIEHLFTAVQSGTVFGAPVTAGAYTIITASEVSRGGGFGSGKSTRATPSAPGSDTTVATEAGGGLGGGAGAVGRPIAAIVVGPDGVVIRPIFDVTKIAQAGIVAWGALLATVLRLRSSKR